MKTDKKEMIGALVFVAILLGFVELMEVQEKKAIAALQPRYQQHIAALNKAKEGDLVKVRNFDDLESERWLVVEGGSSDVIILADLRNFDPSKPSERLTLRRGLNGLDDADEYNLEFIHRDSPAWRQNADWYWTQ